MQGIAINSKELYHRNPLLPNSSLMKYNKANVGLFALIPERALTFFSHGEFSYRKKEGES